MISKEKYKEMSSRWKGKIYQNYGRAELRHPGLINVVDVFKGKHVLEVGPNAGMAAIEIAKVAKEYTGVEREETFWRQSLITKEYIDNPNVTFYNCTVKSYIKRLLDGRIKSAPNACYLSYVLYHFSDDEVEMFKEHILPNLDVIVAQTRARDRSRKGKKEHNSYSFWKQKSVKEYLQGAGFKTATIWGPKKTYHIVVGTKDA